MKKIFTIALVMLMPFLANSAKYTEGKEYTTVNDSITAKPEVREYFSFYCPHCKQFEPFAQQIKASLPSGVSFELNHVDFLRAASPKVQAMLGKAIAAAKQMGLEKEISRAIFDFIQVKRGVITAEKDLRNIAVLAGADGDKFDKAMKSFMVNNQVKQMKKYQDYFTKRKGSDGKNAITGVPTVIINGKYRVNPQGLGGKNFAQEYNDLVAYLLTLK